MAENSFRLQDSHLLWLTFPCHSAKNFQYRILSEPRKYYYSRFGLFRVRSPLLFSSGGSPHIPIDSVYDDKTFLLPDCSIRKSTDITFTYNSPWLIAVSHVLHRLSVPRHSPCALCSLTIIFPTAFTIGSEILWFFVILKIGCFYNLFYPFRNCSIFTFVNIYHFNWGLSLTVDKQYFSLYLLSLFSFQGTFQKRTK